MKKRALIITIILSLTVFLSACGGQSDSTSQSADSANGTTTETAATESKGVELVDSGYSMSEDGEYIHWCAIIKNSEEKTIYEFPKIIVTAYDKEGSVLATEEQVMGIILPGETQAFGTILSSNGGVPDKVEFSTESGDKISSAEDYIPASSFEITDTNAREDEYGDTAFTGKIKNNSTLDCTSASVSIILKKDGKIVYGTTSYVDDLKAGQEKAFDISEYDLPEYDSYEISALHWY